MRFSNFIRWIPFVFVLFLFAGETAVVGAVPQLAEQEIKSSFVLPFSDSFENDENWQVQQGWMQTNTLAHTGNASFFAVPANSPRWPWEALLLLLPALAMTVPAIKRRTPTRRTIIIGIFGMVHF